MKSLTEHLWFETRERTEFINITPEVVVAITAGKVAGLLAASPGALGGLRGLVHLRSILGNIKTLVIPEQFALANANEAFHPDGSLRDAKHLASVEAVARALVGVTSKLGT